MLEALRKSATGWVAKIFIALLVLSFAVWGVADIFTGYRGTDVAEVGETPITIDQFRSALQREIQSTSRQVGTYLTMDQARSLGVDTRVLGRLMAEAALDDEAKSRGLGITDTVIAESIRTDPAFQTPGGQFDRVYFEQVLRSGGYTEALYVAEQRNTLLRQMIADAVGGEVEAPLVLEKAISRYRNEARSAEYVVITPAMAGDIAEPTEEELRTYFDDNKPEIRAPEYRKVAVLAVTPASLVASTDVSEDEIKASYDADPDRFGTPERRTIERIVFADQSAAEQARRDIDGGKSFEDIAADLGLTDDDRKLGTLTKDGVIDPAIGEAAFSLEVDEISQPVAGTFGPALVRVTAIEPGATKTLDDVREEIRTELAVARAGEKILDIYDAIEDDRAAGMTLAEAAQKQGLNYREIAAIDRQGLDADGTPVRDLPRAPRFITEVFDSEIGVEADPLQTSDDGWAWLEVLEVTPSRERSFEEARDMVAEAWRADKVRQAIEAKAKEAAEKLRGGTEMFTLAEELGTTSGLIGPVTRAATDSVFGAPAIQLMFTTPENGVNWTTTASPPQRVVFRVTEIDVPEFKTDEEDAYTAEIAAGISNDVLGQYLQQLEDRIGTSVNPDALRLALGETLE